MATHDAAGEAELLKDEDDPSASGTYLVGLVGTIIFLVLVIFAIALFYGELNRQRVAKAYMVRPEEIQQLQFAQLATLSESRWVDEKAGRVAVPIDQAVSLLVKRVNSVGWPKPPALPSQAAPSQAASGASSAPATAPAGASETP